MDLQSDVKAYLETLTEEQRAAWMINLQLSYSSRVARASHSSEPSASVASLPMTNVERRAEEPLDSDRTWEPPDEQELAQYAQAPQPNALETSEEESGTTHQFHEHAEPSHNGSVPQPEEEITGEATALHQVTVAIQPPVQATTPPVDPMGDEPQQPPARMPQTPVKARPPLPTALPCAQPTPPTEPKTAPEPSFHRPQPKVYHMDKNKQTHWLQTMRWTLQPQPLPASLCLQPYALQGLRGGAMFGGWQSLSPILTAHAISLSLLALAG